MPCTVQPWEAESDERAFNKRTYGVALTDYQLVVRLLCEAVKLIPPIRQSAMLTKWAKRHEERDREIAAMDRKVIAARKKKGT